MVASEPNREADMDITDSESCSLDQTPAPATQTASPLSRAVKNLRNALGGERNEDDREGTTFRFVETEPEISALLEESFHGTVPLFLHPGVRLAREHSERWRRSGASWPPSTFRGAMT